MLSRRVGDYIIIYTFTHTEEKVFAIAHPAHAMSSWKRGPAQEVILIVHWQNAADESAFCRPAKSSGDTLERPPNHRQKVSL
jgi:hypothetical protein